MSLQLFIMKVGTNTGETSYFHLIDWIKWSLKWIKWFSMNSEYWHIFSFKKCFFHIHQPSWESKMTLEVHYVECKHPRGTHKSSGIHQGSSKWQLSTIKRCIYLKEYLTKKYGILSTNKYWYDWTTFRIFIIKDKYSIFWTS